MYPWLWLVGFVSLILDYVICKAIDERTELKGRKERWVAALLCEWGGHGCITMGGIDLLGDQVQWCGSCKL